MTREELEKWIEEHEDYDYDNIKADDVRKLYDELTRWIPVSERLPEYGKVVRVWNSDGERIAHLERITPKNVTPYDYWVSDCTDSCGCCGTWDSEVKAWMPLGKPYEPFKGE